MDTPPGIPEEQELKNLMRQNLELARENNHILKRMVKMGRIAFWAKVVLWAIVLLLPILLIPYIAPFLHAFSGLGTTSGTTLFGVPSPMEFQKAVQEYRTQ